jgi:hypothetical protein
MVNHFASLLINSDLLTYRATFENYKLADTIDEKIVSDVGETVAVSYMFANTDASSVYSPLICRDYHQINLPQELVGVYNVLFPEDASNYYKQFLLYCYLRLVAASDKAEDVKKYDTRVSYDLDDFPEYFKSTQTQITSADNDFKLLLHGALQATHTIQSNINNFIVQQAANTRNITIFSKTEGKYYKLGKSPSGNAVGMVTSLTSSPGSNITDTVGVGGTGLSFNLTGPIDSLFTSTANKHWTFSASAPLNFDFTSVISGLATNYTAVENMLNFARTSCNVSYENMWHTHYNDVYRLAGLLLAYVERMNFVWLQKAM